MFAPAVKRLVDLVDRGPRDDAFFPSDSGATIFRREWRPYHNMVPDVVELGYKGHVAWGSRITIPLTRQDSGDLLQWLCLRLKPRTWLGADLESRLLSGLWDYADASGAWMWAGSLGSIAVARVEFEIGDTLIESWSGDWMDVWSRAWMDGGRGAVWDSDIYGQLPPWELSDSGRPAWTTVLPTEDGYVYCWLPLAFLRRPQTAFPLIAVGDQQEIRVHLTLRPFADVVRRRTIPRADPCEVPMGSTIVLLDRTGPTPVPWEFVLPNAVPGFEDATVFAGVVQTEDPLRSAYMRIPLEMIYEPVREMRFTVEGERAVGVVPLLLTELNGPVRELCWVVRRRGAWRWNEWTNYGAMDEGALIATIPTSETQQTVVQEPIIRSARLLVGNAVWRDETEGWWRAEYGMAHRGGVRLAAGMVYGFVCGDGAGWTAEDIGPAGTVNASRAPVRLELDFGPGGVIGPGGLGPCVADGVSEGYDIIVWGIGVGFLRFVSGIAAPVFMD